MSHFKHIALYQTVDVVLVLKGTVVFCFFFLNRYKAATASQQSCNYVIVRYFLSVCVD